MTFLSCRYSIFVIRIELPARIHSTTLWLCWKFMSYPENVAGNVIACARWYREWKRCAVMAWEGEIEKRTRTMTFLMQMCVLRLPATAATKKYTDSIIFILFSMVFCSNFLIYLEFCCCHFPTVFDFILQSVLFVGSESVDHDWIKDLRGLFGQNVLTSLRKMCQSNQTHQKYVCRSSALILNYWQIKRWNRVVFGISGGQ